MGEIKSVKVDNWGVFFLQKLQNFFNKTDYCDLTLQFRDNSQLKVHRLVLSACTDYFNVLEQTCEVIDDALIMPNELQADVVVPIVNFMYTGTLEFELKMYGKLLRTAKEMNMTVLLKLLEAHRRTMENVNRAQRPPSPKAIRRRAITGVPSMAPPGQFQNQTQQTRVGVVPSGGGGGGNVQRRMIQTKTVGTTIAPGVQIFRQQIGSTSVVRTTTMKGQQPAVESYIKNEPDDYETITTTQPTSPFEQLRKGYNNNKRPALTAFSPPPSKKPNLEDVKEFAEQQRMRKQIAAEYGEDHEFEGMLDDDIHNDDDDDEGTAAMGTGVVSASSNNSSTAAAATATATEGTRNTSITFKHESDGQPPTIIVKDSSGSKLNHAKIISEVLRQYPHLAKGNKNIKLKIMPNSGGQTQRIVVKKESEQTTQQPLSQQHVPQQNIAKSVAQQKVNLPTQLLSSQVTVKAGDRIISTGQGQQISTTKPVITATQKPVATTPSNVSAPTTVDTSQQKRRIDSKTMHALIALGAENMTGPWLCLRCGVNGRPISIPSYRGFRRHLINTHKESIDPALCEHCGWRSRTNRELHFHMQTEHKIKTQLYTFPECVLCIELFLDTNALNQHMLDSHPSANKQQCIYCNKIFIKEIQLYTHMKLYHKHQAIEDGIIDASDEEFGVAQEEDDDEEDEEDDAVAENLDTDSDREFRKSTIAEQQHKDGKVKILSDISLPMASSIIKLDGGEAINTQHNAVDEHTKFVTADGNEMILTDEQRKEIISQLNQDQNNGGVVMVLQETIFPAGGEEAVGTAAETTSARDDIVSEEEMDDGNQVYDNLPSSQNDASTSNKTDKDKDESKEAMDNLEWAENLISEHDSADISNINATTKKNDDDENNTRKDDINQKLKELTGDWSEDENEDDIIADLGKVEKSNTEAELNTKEAEKFTTDQTVGESEKESLGNGDDKTCSNKQQSKNNADTDAEVEQAIKEEREIIKSIETKKEHKPDNLKSDDDDGLDLAMQNLHEGDVVDIKTEKNTSGEFISLPSLNEDDDEKMDVDEIKKDVDDIIESSRKKVASIVNTPAAVASEVLEQNRELLDELMAATTTTENSNLIVQKSEIVEDFDEAELKDVEEFASLDKSNVEHQSTHIGVAATKEAKIKGRSSSSEADNKLDEETKIVEKSTAKETVSDVAKSLTSDWDDIEDDDDDDDDDDLDEVVGNDAE